MGWERQDGAATPVPAPPWPASLLRAASLCRPSIYPSVRPSVHSSLPPSLLPGAVRAGAPRGALPEPRCAPPVFARCPVRRLLIPCSPVPREHPGLKHRSGCLCHRPLAAVTAFGWRPLSAPHFVSGCRCCARSLRSLEVLVCPCRVPSLASLSSPLAPYPPPLPTLRVFISLSNYRCWGSLSSRGDNRCRGGPVPPVSPGLLPNPSHLFNISTAPILNRTRLSRGKALLFSLSLIKKKLPSAY